MKAQSTLIYMVDRKTAIKLDVQTEQNMGETCCSQTGVAGTGNAFASKKTDASPESERR
jgi:hypothetical protein